MKRRERKGKRGGDFLSHPRAGKWKEEMGEINRAGRGERQRRRAWMGVGG